MKTGISSFLKGSCAAWALLCLCAAAPSAPASQPIQYQNRDVWLQKVIDNGDDAEMLINFVIISEGFVAGELDGFAQVAEARVQEMLLHQDFLHDLRHLINVYLVRVADNVSGIGYGSPADTLLRGFVSLVTRESEIVRKILRENGQPFALLEALGLAGNYHPILLMNCPYPNVRDSASMGLRVFRVKQSSDYGIWLHELGHSLWGLVDEYDEPNRTATSGPNVVSFPAEDWPSVVREDLPWGHWIPQNPLPIHLREAGNCFSFGGPVGLFQGTLGSDDYWRATCQSRMRHTLFDFSGPQKEYIVSLTARQATDVQLQTSSTRSSFWASDLLSNRPPARLGKAASHDKRTVALLSAYEAAFAELSDGWIDWSVEVSSPLAQSVAYALYVDGDFQAQQTHGSFSVYVPSGRATCVQIVARMDLPAIDSYLQYPQSANWTHADPRDPRYRIFTWILGHGAWLSHPFPIGQTGLVGSLHPPTIPVNAPVTWRELVLLAFAVKARLDTIYGPVGGSGTSISLLLDALWEDLEQNRMEPDSLVSIVDAFSLANPLYERMQELLGVSRLHYAVYSGKQANQLPRMSPLHHSLPISFGQLLHLFALPCDFNLKELGL